MTRRPVESSMSTGQMARTRPASDSAGAAAVTAAAVRLSRSFGRAWPAIGGAPPCRRSAVSGCCGSTAFPAT
jgi:hypothetical protein